MSHDDIDPAAADALVSEHYDALKRIARAKRRGSRSGHAMLTTDLLHETWLKLRRQTDWRDEAHFFRTCALAMRQVIVDAARREMRVKRGGQSPHLDYDDWRDVLPDFSETPEQIVRIGEVIDAMQRDAPELVDIINLRYFGGFTEAEVAHTLSLSARTVRRKWTLARAYLASALE